MPKSEAFLVLLLRKRIGDDLVSFGSLASADLSEWVSREF